jgi:hypothetical protein
MKLQDVTSHSKCFLNRLLPTIVVIKVNSRMQIVIYATSEQSNTFFKISLKKVDYFSLILVLLSCQKWITP